MHFCRRDRSRPTVAELLQAPLGLDPPNTLRLVRAELLQTCEKPFRQSGTILHLVHFSILRESSHIVPPFYSISSFLSRISRAVSPPTSVVETSRRLGSLGDAASLGFGFDASPDGTKILLVRREREGSENSRRWVPLAALNDVELQHEPLPKTPVPRLCDDRGTQTLRQCRSFQGKLAPRS